MRLIGVSFLLFLKGAFATDHLAEFSEIPHHIPQTDYIFLVEISTQKNQLYYKGTLIDDFLVSTGSKSRYKGNREMKEGLWRLTKRMAHDLAPIYGARLIYLEKFQPRLNRFVYTNKAFHGTNEPHNIGKPTSMGCVYHYDEDIIDLYSFIPYGTLVITKQILSNTHKGY